MTPTINPIVEAIEACRDWLSVLTSANRCRSVGMTAGRCMLDDGHQALHESKDEHGNPVLWDGGR